jgi:hypothetical protein
LAEANAWSHLSFITRELLLLAKRESIGRKMFGRPPEIFQVAFSSFVGKKAWDLYT